MVDSHWGRENCFLRHAATAPHALEDGPMPVYVQPAPRQLSEILKSDHMKLGEKKSRNLRRENVGLNKTNMHM